MSDLGLSLPDLLRLVQAHLFLSGSAVVAALFVVGKEREATRLMERAVRQGARAEDAERRARSRWASWFAS